jgi:hypothetical protein
VPLQFESISHGSIAFGFFNIETDLILLNHYFLFAGDFCRSVSSIAEGQIKGIYKDSWDIYLFEQREKIGTLMGAIHGADLRGFIGEVYRCFPFPKERTKFKQKPDGIKRRPEIEEMIGNFAKRTSISVLIDEKMEQITIGEFVFSRPAFQDLIHYVWVGGFPRWQDDLRPDYVLSMKERIERSNSPLFEGLMLDS